MTETSKLPDDVLAYMAQPPTRAEMYQFVTQLAVIQTRQTDMLRHLRAGDEEAAEATLRDIERRMKGLQATFELVPGFMSASRQHG